MNNEALLLWQRRLVVAAIVLASGVIMLGAWTRLSDAGLGCPDWPGCYGHLDVRDAVRHVDQINASSPGALREAHKTVPEMVHRYVASTLGLLVLALAALAWRNRAERRQPVGLPLILAVLVAVQGLLGMWTVTLGLQPTIVMLHLLGGFGTLTLLVWLAARLFRWPEFLNDCDVRMMRRTTGLAIAVVLLQIALGGWTTANYAALVCTEFPVCEQGWQEHIDFEEAFTFWGHEHDRPDYEFGVLESDARTTIHVMHRFGALLVFLVVGTLAVKVWARARCHFYRKFAAVIAFLLVLQVCLGIANVALQAPLAVAVAHNFGAVLLLISLVLFARAIHTEAERGAP